MEWFLHSGKTSARLVRTLVEVVLSWLIANIGDIFNLFKLDSSVKTLVVSAFIMIFTAILGFISDNKEKEVDEE